MADYILNRVPSKAVCKTPYELWSGRKPSLNHLHVWGCCVEAKMYNPNKKKLYSKTISCNFIGFPDKSKGYSFYSLSLPNRIFGTSVAKFIESGEDFQDYQSEEMSFDFDGTMVALPNINLDLIVNNDTMNTGIAQDH